LSSSLDPDVTWIISDLFWWNSVAVVKPIGTSLAASAYVINTCNNKTTKTIERLRKCEMLIGILYILSF
jgi:predicted transporter